MGRLLDDKLIVPEVCMRCAACCYWPVKLKDGSKPERKQFYNSFFNIKIVEIKTGIPVEGLVPCSKLDYQSEHRQLCSIYEHRPTMCRKYNCFQSANIHGHTPRNFDKIVKLIHYVHGPGTNVYIDGEPE